MTWARCEKLLNQSYAGNSLEVIRPEGWNRGSAIATHKNMIYDYEIDNSELSVEQTAKHIYRAFVDCKQPRAFQKLYSGMI